jgi:hypothetical protein
MKLEFPDDNASYMDTIKVKELRAHKPFENTKIELGYFRNFNR